MFFYALAVSLYSSEGSEERCVYRLLDNFIFIAGSYNNCSTIILSSSSLTYTSLFSLIGLKLKATLFLKFVFGENLLKCVIDEPFYEELLTCR